MTPVKGALLDDLQDCVISEKHRNRWEWQTPTRGMMEQSTTIHAAGPGYPGFVGVPPFYLTALADDAIATFPAGRAIAGTRITDVGFVMSGDGVGTGPAFASLWRTGPGGSALVGYVDIVDPPGVDAKYTAAIAPVVVGADETLFWYVGMKKATWVIRTVGFACDRL